MHKTLICKICGNQYISKDYREGRSKYCSRSCNGKSGEFWSIATKDQKINRLKKFFEKYVIKNQEGCWGWKGTLLDGRGRLYFKKKALQAHRASWMIHKGDIPDGMYVCHKCDNGICANPEHLFLGTPSDNICDLLIKNKTKLSKLTIDQVKDIKKMLEDGEKQINIAKKFNVHPSTICDINKGRTRTKISLPYSAT